MQPPSAPRPSNGCKAITRERRLKRLTRVLHVFGSLEVGGAETWLLAILRGWGSSRYEHHFCLLGLHDGPLVAGFESLGCQVHRCPIQPAATFPLRLSRLLRDGQYDVVHSHVLLFSGLILTLARTVGVRSRIAHSHNVSDGAGNGLFRRLYRFIMRRLLRSSMTQGLACSETAGGYLFGAVDERRARMTVLRYGIDLSPFERSPDRAQLRHERHELGLPRDGPLITHVGSLTRQKNQSFLLWIFAEARRLRPDIKLVVAGEGSLRLELEQAIRTLRLSDSVRLLGERDDVPQVLMASDGFVLTSRFEGSPLSLLEAQAAGLPCLVPSHVASAAGDGAENGVAQVGLDEAVQVWAGALAAVVDQPRRSAAVACRSLIDLGYDVSTSRAKMEAVYEGEIDHCLRPEERASLVAERLGN